MKAKYGLWMTAAEKDATRRTLQTCRRESVPTEPGRIHPRSPARIAQPPQPSTPPPPTRTTTRPGGSCEPGYTPCLPIADDLDCGEINDALKPIRVTGSDPYNLDGDDDGVGCES